MNGLYWGLTACHILGYPETLPRGEVINFVLSCLRDNGGFGAAPGHDAHMLYTVSAVQILATLDAFSELDGRVDGGRMKVANCKLAQSRYSSAAADVRLAVIASLQDPQTGAFHGDEWGETDTRFLYGALNALSLLNLLHLIDTNSCVNYIQACANFDGGYGTTPGAESHSGQIFTCVNALAILGRLDTVDRNRLGGWLSERQLPNGGLNGRPEKLEDVCYSWWVLSSLATIERLHWIDTKRLQNFILKCQDPEEGGIADRPGDMVDVFHTHFGLAGLSLMGYQGLQEIDPVYCMPRKVTQRIFQLGQAI